MDILIRVLGWASFIAGIFCFLNALFMNPENIMQQIYASVYGVGAWLCMAVFVLSAIYRKISMYLAGLPPVAAHVIDRTA